MTTGNGGAAIGLSNDNKLTVIGELVANEPDPRAGTSSYVGNDCTDTWWDWNSIAEDVGFYIPSCNEGFFIYWVTTGEDPVTLGAESRVAVTDGIVTADDAGDYEAFFAPGTVIPAGMYLWVESGEIPPIEFIVADPIPDQTPVVDSVFTLDVSAHFVNGAPPVIYTIFSGSLPPGLTLAANGTVSGTPTTPGSTGSVVFRGTDNRGNSANSNGVPFTTVAALAFSGTIAAQSNVEDSAITPLNISSYWSGGATPLVYSVFSGTLPVGLTLDPATGIISGTPTTPAGAVALVFRATDAGAVAVNSNSMNWTITANGLPPTGVAGLALWIDYTDTTQLLQTSAGAAATANNDPIGLAKSKDATGVRCNYQPTAANRPLLKLAILNGKSVGRFDGSNDFMWTHLHAAGVVGASLSQITMLNGVVATLFFAGQVGVIVDGGILLGQKRMILDWAANKGPIMALQTPGGSGTLWGSNTYAATLANVASRAITTVPAIYVLRCNGGTATELRVNNGAWHTVVETSQTFNVAGRLQTCLDTGGVNYAAADIAHICLYNAAVSDANVTLLVNWLADQLGITV